MQLRVWLHGSFHGVRPLCNGDTLAPPMRTATRPDAARGVRIRELRVARSLRQEDLAGLIDVSVDTVGRWEAGKPIQAGNLELLAKKLGTTPDYIRDGGDVLPSDPRDETDQRLDEVLLRLIRIEGAVTAVAGTVGAPAPGTLSPAPGEAGTRRRRASGPRKAKGAKQSRPAGR